MEGRRLTAGAARRTLNVRPPRARDVHGLALAAVVRDRELDLLILLQTPEPLAAPPEVERG